MKTIILVRRKIEDFEILKNLKKSIIKYYEGEGFIIKFSVLKLKECCCLKVETNVGDAILDLMSGFCEGWISCAGI